MKRNWLCFLVVISFCVQAFSYTLIISDIDDTIKVSHVLNHAGKVSNALNVTKPFTGMAELYQLLLSQNPSSSRIVYLSNAPKEVAKIPAMKISHQAFLDYNNFPAGELALRADIFDPNHKITEIRRLLNQERPDVVILIGDNGERDPEIYNQAVQEFGARMRMISFIHILYASKKPLLLPKFMAETGSKIYPGQIGYVTPVEIALELQAQKLLSGAAAEWMTKNILPRILNEDSFKVETLRSIAFPFFSSCGDFVWRWPLSNETAKLSQKIKKMCQ
jgi:hypothetical protein